MAYEAETFRSRPSTRASRRATAAEVQDYLLDVLKGMNCPATVVDLAVKSKEEWQGQNERAILAALVALERDGKAVRQGTRWLAKRRF
jgi:hypothetical protein